VLQKHKQQDPGPLEKPHQKETLLVAKHCPPARILSQAKSAQGQRKMQSGLQKSGLKKGG
jgi:hypothetical protein